MRLNTKIENNMKTLFNRNSKTAIFMSYVVYFALIIFLLIATYFITYCTLCFYLEFELDSRLTISICFMALVAVFSMRKKIKQRIIIEDGWNHRMSEEEIKRILITQIYVKIGKSLDGVKIEDYFVFDINYLKSVKRLFDTYGKSENFDNLLKDYSEFYSMFTKSQNESN